MPLRASASRTQNTEKLYINLIYYADNDNNDVFSLMHIINNEQLTEQVH